MFVSQVLEFVRSHRDTFTILLKTETEDLSISVLEEMRLVVSLGSSVLSAVPKTELVSLVLSLIFYLVCLVAGY